MLSDRNQSEKSIHCLIPVLGHCYHRRRHHRVAAPHHVQKAPSHQGSEVTLTPEQRPPQTGSLARGAPELAPTWVPLIPSPQGSRRPPPGAGGKPPRLRNGSPLQQACAAKAGYVGDVGLIPESGRSSGGGHGNSLQYSCLENPHRQGACLNFT